MKTHRIRPILFLIVFHLLFTLTPAVAQRQEFVLPVARLGEEYRVEIEAVLRDNYRLKLESGSANAVIVWRADAGEVPAGLSVRTDGTITGNLTKPRVGFYQFSLIAIEMAAKDEPLELRFSMEVKPGRLRLTKVEGPRLVPVDTGATVSVVSNHASSVASTVIEPKETSAKSEETEVSSESSAKIEAEAAPEPPAIRQMKNLILKISRIPLAA